VQDAVNLGWKLAQVVQGRSGEELLDTYHRERHPVAARVLRNALAQVALNRGDDASRAAREAVVGLLAFDDARRAMAGMLSGLDLAYPTDFAGAESAESTGPAHPLVGRRMPDLDLRVSGPVIGAHTDTTVYSLLHAAQPVLLVLDASLSATAHEAIATAATPHVRVVEATTDGPWALPVLGEVPPVRAVLIRPDGHVAWVDGPAETLRDPNESLLRALRFWFGR
jgi:3-(3-hydroxy-phenyl)propionate hydroxylase